MENYIIEIEALKVQIRELEQENSCLKKLLQSAGIDFISANKSSTSDSGQAFDFNQGGRIIQEEITRNHARQFYSYFWGRMDVFSKRSQNKSTGKSGYYPQCDNFWRRGVCPKASGVKVKCKDCDNRCWKHLAGTAGQIESIL